MFCPSCGNQNADTSKFCEKCGKALVAASPAAAAPADSRIRAGPSAPAQTGQSVTGKNPWVAVVLSFVIVGVGQFYNGDPKKGAVMLICAIVGGLLSGGLIAIPFWIWAMIDAYRVASGQGKIW